MAIVGHFSDLTNAQRLVQSELLAGVVEETIEIGHMIPKLPVTVIDSKSLLYNREGTLPSAAFYDIHEQIPWSADTTFTQVEVELKRIIRQDVLDNFMIKTYKNPNDYKALILKSLVKGCLRTIETKLIYGDTSTYPKEFDGLWKLCTSGMQVDLSGALTLTALRDACDAVRPEPNFIMMNRNIMQRMDAMLQEAGIASYVGFGRLTYGQDQLGKRLPMWNGIPIYVSDFITQVESGVAAQTGSNETSVWVGRIGSILDGGISLVVGGDTGGADFYNIVELEELEDYDAGGIRLVAYCALALGSTKALYQIAGVTDAAVAV